MADVVFNPDERDYRRSGRPGSQGGLVGLMMRLGARSERSANQALFVLAILIFILAGFILYNNL